MEAIDGLSSDQRDNSAIILQVLVYRRLWDKAQSDYKDQDLKAGHGTISWSL